MRWWMLLVLCSCSELADVDRSEVGRDSGRPTTPMDASAPRIDATVSAPDAGDAG